MPRALVRRQFQTRADRRDACPTSSRSVFASLRAYLQAVFKASALSVFSQVNVSNFLPPTVTLPG